MVAFGLEALGCLGAGGPAGPLGAYSRRESLSEEGSGSEDREQGIRERLSSRGTDALGEVAQALLENSVFNQALSAALGAGEKALEAQRSAMGALNLPSASDVERLERRLRSLSSRVEQLEDALDDLIAEIGALRRQQEGAGAAPERDSSSADAGD